MFIIAQAHVQSLISNLHQFIHVGTVIKRKRFTSILLANVLLLMSCKHAF